MIWSETGPICAFASGGSGMPGRVCADRAMSSGWSKASPQPAGSVPSGRASRISPLSSNRHSSVPPAPSAGAGRVGQLHGPCGQGAQLFDQLVPVGAQARPGGPARVDGGSLAGCVLDRFVRREGRIERDPCNAIHPRRDGHSPQNRQAPAVFPSGVRPGRVGVLDDQPGGRLNATWVVSVWLRWRAKAAAPTSRVPSSDRLTAEGVRTDPSAPAISLTVPSDRKTESRECVVPRSIQTGKLSMRHLQITFSISRRERGAAQRGRPLRPGPGFGRKRSRYFRESGS